MPRGKKSKHRAREKRHRQAQSEDQGHGIAHTTAAGEEESPSSPSLTVEGSPPSSPAAGTPQQSQSGPASNSPAATVSCASSGEGAKSQKKERPSSSQAPPSSGSAWEDLLASKVGMLVRALLHKYEMKEPITKEEMLKIINKRYKAHFPEILQRVSERMELTFGLDLKEVDPSRHCYILVSQMDLHNEKSPSDGGRNLPKNGLLMPLLGVIFLNGNRATEEEMWEFLNTMGVYAGRRHFIFGEPRKLITVDFVQQKFLEYRQVPHSDPPRYEFLWGPKAYAETSKMKVLEFWAKINNTIPTTFQTQYEEALRDGEERARARAAARAHSRAMTSSCQQR
ncbi:melanoma-associated antigen B17 [Eptesicus fuscus]|uniref:melanoma-associated antigen B17 n=1 Tax=Eptesicus fuscus TaxID=29078 RepID=UPI00046BB99B|nr:melanoma-associated antigen B17 [Eptesicus fuscus]XP_054571529.1 melanoma-associated antigen B17 [Eptesicus fuscus]